MLFKNAAPFHLGNGAAVCSAFDRACGKTGIDSPLAENEDDQDGDHVI